MNVDVTPLPGIGIRKDFAIEGGRRIGVITRRDGSVELIASREGDPDSCQVSIPLSVAEAATMSSLLGAPQLVQKLQASQDRIPNVTTRTVTVTAESPYHGRALGDTRMRTRTGASIVAILRAGNHIPSPSPDEVLTMADILFVVGTEEGLDAAASVVRDG